MKLLYIVFPQMQILQQKIVTNNLDNLEEVSAIIGGLEFYVEMCCCLFYLSHYLLLSFIWPQPDVGGS